MNRIELIARITEETGHKKSHVEDIIQAFEKVTAETLKRGDNLRLVGFGSLMVQERAARKARNPRTGEEIDVAASKRVTFKAGKRLLSKINE